MNIKISVQDMMTDGTWGEYQEPWETESVEVETAMELVAMCQAPHNRMPFASEQVENGIDYVVFYHDGSPIRRFAIIKPGNVH